MLELTPASKAGDKVHCRLMRGQLNMVFGHRRRPESWSKQMDLTHGQTGRTIPVVVDNVVYRQDGCLLVESMFSGLVDLTSPAVDLAARIHPSKAEAFEWIISGQCSVTTEGKPTPVVPDVQLHVNNPRGGIAVRHFSEFFEASRQLRERGQSGEVRATVILAGFDPGAEPVLREMRDGNLLLVFAFIPPRVTEGQPAKARRFDLNTFGAEVERAAGVPVAWDDKEVFVVQRPRSDTSERIRGFVQSDWGASGR
jgi:hypothetical protein